MNKKAIYAGSFDPFTNGHLHIAKESCELFDFVYIVLAINPNKKRQYSIELMKVAIEDTLKELEIINFEVIITDRLISDIAFELECSYLIRGLRNPNDFAYEENIAKINAELNPDLKTIYLRADNEIISSSFVRELLKYDKDISKYVSVPIFKLILNYEK